MEKQLAKDDNVNDNETSTDVKDLVSSLERLADI